jgi:general secretion pathway protein G
MRPHRLGWSSASNLLDNPTMFEPHCRRRSPLAVLPPPLGAGGFTLIELITVVVILGILAGLAFPPLRAALDQAKVARAIGDIKAIQVDIMAIEVGEQPLPADLGEVGRGGVLDPWGNPYVYYPFPPGNGNPGGARKDRFLVPVNSTFDLYSMGPDGVSSPPFTAGPSQDDIVRANDGGYVGRASGF